jgi:hypothetical protein
MTATLDGVAARKKGKPEPTAEQKLAEERMARAREQGVSLTGLCNSGARRLECSNDCPFIGGSRAARRNAPQSTLGARCGGSWTGAPGNPSAVSAISAMICAIRAAGDSVA